MRIPDFDFKNPDYPKIFRERTEALYRLRANPKSIPLLKAFYKENPAQFLVDWGITLDPKLVEKGLPAVIPFLLFPRQIELVDKVVWCWKNQKPLIVDKTRQMGISWLGVSISCTLALFHEGFACGWGSRKEAYVDSGGDPKSLFYKARMFLQYLPAEFRGGWIMDKHSQYMRIVIPSTKATIIGEAGDNIGRGNSTSIYFVDEAAFLERPHLVEASLSQTTNCRIDISTPNGMANPFAEKRHNGKIETFSFSWRDDPRKDDAWYEKQKQDLDYIVLAQEVDINYAASVEGVIIPQEWVQAAIDAHIKLNITPTGAKVAALDCADQGADKNAFCGIHGILVKDLEEWSGQGGDIFKTTERAITLCDNLHYDGFRYDADGLGAGVRGDARIINERRVANGQKSIILEAFRGSDAVFNPEGEDVKGRKNKDYFGNRKAQAWWELRGAFQRTYRWVVDKIPCDPDAIISIPSYLNHRQRLCSELSQPVATQNAVGKMIVDKSPDGTKSPNLGDALMIVKSRATRQPMRINPNILNQVASAHR